jgi:hypothetical protein
MLNRRGDKTMLHKISVAIAFLFLSVCLLACHTIIHVTDSEVKNFSPMQRKHIKGVETRMGAVIKFAEWGKVTGDSIIGAIHDTEQLFILKKDIRTLKRDAAKRIMFISCFDGAEYNVGQYAEEDDRVVLMKPVKKELAIPLSDVRRVAVREPDDQYAAGDLEVSLVFQEMVYIDALIGSIIDSTNVKWPGK